MSVAIYWNWLNCKCNHVFFSFRKRYLAFSSLWRLDGIAHKKSYISKLSTDRENSKGKCLVLKASTFQRLNWSLGFKSHPKGRVSTWSRKYGNNPTRSSQSWIRTCNLSDQSQVQHSTKIPGFSWENSKQDFHF